MARTEITAAQHAEIRRLLADTTLSQIEIASRVGVGRQAVTKAARGGGRHGDGQPVQRPMGAPRKSLSEAEAIEIRRLLADTTLSQIEIAAEVGVSSAQVGKIAAGKAWTQLGGPVTRPESTLYVQLTGPQVARIRHLLSNSALTHAQIASIVRANQGQVSLIAEGATWTRTGQRTPPTKLTDREVTEIRELLATTTLSGLAIARQFGVSPPTVSSIATGARPGLDGPVERPRGRWEARAVEIRRRLEAGQSHRQIAEDCDVPRATVSEIATGKRWSRLGPPPRTPKEQP